VSPDERFEIRMVWELADYVRDPEEHPEMVWVEAPQAIDMLQEALADLTGDGLAPVDYYLKKYGRYDDEGEVRKAAVVIRAKALQ